MSDIAIKVEGLGKQYLIGQRESYRTLRDILANAANWIPGKVKAKADNLIWALKDLNFEVKKGEVVGIIGRNGAGKSTLLKIISRITQPTEGSVDIYGRVNSLLEIGTGFHPELTGRENLYLSAAIMGMRKREIDRKFDEIVAFAGVEKFIDTPVKHYSSGMYTRLAFSVAAHLDSDILLVDEVLAVGDIEFQKKCLGKMDSVAQQGRTILFINHHMGHIRRLCNSAIWLDDGKIRKSGPVAEVAAAYQTVLTNPEFRSLTAGEHGFFSWTIEGKNTNILEEEGPFNLRISLRVKRAVYNGILRLVLKSADGQSVGGWGFFGVRLESGSYSVDCRFPFLPVRPGVYYWLASLWDGSSKVDSANLLPELIVAVPEHSRIDNDAAAGVLNLPCEMKINPEGSAG